MPPFPGLKKELRPRAGRFQEPGEGNGIPGFWRTSQEKSSLFAGSWITGKKKSTVFFLPFKQETRRKSLQKSTPECFRSSQKIRLNRTRAKRRYPLRKSHALNRRRFSAPLAAK